MGTPLRAVTLTPRQRQLPPRFPPAGLVFPEIPWLPEALVLMGCYYLPCAPTHHHW